MRDKANNGVATSVAASATVVSILAATTNGTRRGATVFYDAAAILYLVLSSSDPTTSVFTVKLGGTLQTYYEVPFDYQGEIRGIWSAATGAAAVTVLT